MVGTCELYGVGDVIIIVFPDPKCGDPKCESFNWKPKKISPSNKNPPKKIRLEGSFLTIFHQGQAFAKRRRVPCGTWRVIARSGSAVHGRYPVKVFKVSTMNYPSSQNGCIMILGT